MVTSLAAAEEAFHLVSHKAVLLSTVYQSAEHSVKSRHICDNIFRFAIFLEDMIVVRSARLGQALYPHHGLLP